MPQELGCIPEELRVVFNLLHDLVTYPTCLFLIVLQEFNFHQNNTKPEYIDYLERKFMKNVL